MTNDAAGADAVAGVDPGMHQIASDATGAGAGVRLVVTTSWHLAEHCTALGVPIIMLSGDAATNRERIRSALDTPRSAPVDETTAAARSWLAALRAEEARTYASRTAAEKTAETHRQSHLDAINAHVAHLEGHIGAIEASKSWRVATALQRARARTRRGSSMPPPEDPAPTDTIVQPVDVSEAAASPMSLPERVDLIVADATNLGRESIRDPALTVWVSPASPQPLGDAPIIALLDPGARLLWHGLHEATATLHIGKWDAVLTSERAHAGEPALEPRGGWSLLTARAWAAASGLVVVRRSFVERHGGLRPEAGWDAAHDLLLRAGHDIAVTSVAAAGCSRDAPLGPRRLRRAIPGVLMHDLEQRGEGQSLEAVSGLPGAFRHRQPRGTRPVVSVIVPTRDQPAFLRTVIEGLEATRWQPLEIVIVDNDSTDPQALDILDRSPHRVERAPIPFNFPRLVNRGASVASGDVLVFLNNDIELTDPDWIEPLIELTQYADVGPVGALLNYPDGTIQHCGMAIGPDGPMHPLRGIQRDRAPAGLALVPGERTAVTAACMAIKSTVFWQLGGFEPLLAHDYNDVDLCLRAWQAGYRVCFTPFAEMVHHESVTRGTAVTPDTVGDWLLMRSRWAGQLDRPDRWWPSGIAMATGLPQPA